MFHFKFILPRREEKYTINKDREKGRKGQTEAEREIIFKKWGLGGLFVFFKNGT